MTPSPYHHTKSDPMTPENLLNRNLLNWPYTPKLLPYYGPQRVTNKAAATSPHMPARQLLFLTKTQQGWKGETSTEWTGKMVKNYIILFHFVIPPPWVFCQNFCKLNISWLSVVCSKNFAAIFSPILIAQSELLRFYGSILTRDRACFQVQLWIAHKMIE